MDIKYIKFHLLQCLIVRGLNLAHLLVLLRLGAHSMFIFYLTVTVKFENELSWGMKEFLNRIFFFFLVSKQIIFK